MTETTTPALKQKRDLSHINNVDDLLLEARQLRLKIRTQENELREHLRALPKETVKLGLGNVVQPFLRNKAAGLALTAATALAGNFIVKKAAASATRSVFSSITRKGLLAAGQFLLKKLLSSNTKNK
ncbi:MAG TPA: hypothetical protein PLQ32_13590 [Flavihumibacter sp.]|nr:hypothetical protein [Flavihumibacter sp.]